jgi:hypothetical protein
VCVFFLFKKKTRTKGCEQGQGNKFIPCASFLCMRMCPVVSITDYSGPLTYELNSFPRAGRNSSWS